MDPGERARLLARLSRLLHAGHIDADGEEAATARADLEAAVAEQQPARAVDALMLLIGRATGSGAPAVQRVCGALLAGCLARPGGVRALLEHLLGAAGEGDEEAFRRAARAIASPPPQAADPDVRPDPGPAPRAGAGAAEVRQAYLGPVCGQLAELLAAEGSGRALARGAAAAAHAVTARSPGRAQRLLVRPLLAPLLAEPAPGAEEEAERAAGGSLRALEALLARHAAPPTLFPSPALGAAWGLEARRTARSVLAAALAAADPDAPPAAPGRPRPSSPPRPSRGPAPAAAPLREAERWARRGAALGALAGAEGVPPAVAAELFLAALAAAPRGPDEPVPCAPPSRRAPLAADAGAGAGRARRAPSRCSRRSPRRGPRGAGRLPPRPGRGAVGRAARLLAALLEREGGGGGEGPAPLALALAGALLSGLVPGPGRPPRRPLTAPPSTPSCHPSAPSPSTPGPPRPRPAPPRPDPARSPDVAAAASAARAALAALRGDPSEAPGRPGPGGPGGELAEAIADLTRADAAPPERAAGAGAVRRLAEAGDARLRADPGPALAALLCASRDPDRPAPPRSRPLPPPGAPDGAAGQLRLTEALVDAARRLGPLLTPHAACAMLALLEGTRDGDAGVRASSASALGEALAGPSPSRGRGPRGRGGLPAELVRDARRALARAADDPAADPLTRSHAAAALAALADAVRAALGGQPALEIRMPGTAGPAARWRLGPTQLRG
eukprot:tig00001057_g6684.t1